MTNYEALYTQAMAHVAMLREALEYLLSWYDNHDYEDRGMAALNATGPDVEAWKEMIEMEAFKRGAASATTAHYEQLATVTAERDALREALGKYGEIYDYVCDLKDNAPLREHHEGLTQMINIWLRYGEKALAQKGGE